MDNTASSFYSCLGNGVFNVYFFSFSFCMHGLLYKFSRLLLCFHFVQCISFIILHVSFGLQEDVLTFIHAQTLKTKHEEQFKQKVHFDAYIHTYNTHIQTHIHTCLLQAKPLQDFHINLEPRKYSFFICVTVLYIYI